jgi:hypothetical protein
MPIVSIEDTIIISSNSTVSKDIPSTSIAFGSLFEIDPPHMKVKNIKK